MRADDNQIWLARLGEREDSLRRSPRVGQQFRLDLGTASGSTRKQNIRDRSNMGKWDLIQAIRRSL